MGGKRRGMASLGGALAAGAAGAAAVRLGLQRRRQGDLELASAEELPRLQQALREVRRDVDASHRALTQAWGEPLALFGAEAAAAAEARGVPRWALARVWEAQGLVERAVELGDLADMYEAQLDIVANADCGERGVLKSPVCMLIERLDDLAQRLKVHVHVLEAARNAFASPKSLATEGAAASSFSHCNVRAEPELPISIVRDQHRPGLVWNRQAKVLHRLLRKDSGTAHAEDDDPFLLMPLHNELDDIADIVNVDVQGQPTKQSTIHSDASSFVFGTRHATLGLLGFPVTLEDVNVGNGADESLPAVR